jgi:hypothetical protein
MARRLVGYIILLLLGLLFAYLIHQKGARDYQTALELYKQISSANANSIALRTTNELRQIYQNIRTISLLPNIKDLDRHATNLETNTRSAINEIYHNLSSNVSVSEIYIVPADLNPDAIDPVTKQPQIPNIMFDGTISAAGDDDEESGPHLEEVETYEYHQLVQHMTWLKEHYPTNAHLEVKDIPIISGENIITCDNTQFKKTLKDPDRTGIIFSVPIYDPKGQFKGTVSAIILNNVLRDLVEEKIPAKETFVLINKGYNYFLENDQVKSSPYKKWIEQGTRDPEIIYSSVIPLALNDPQSIWELWVGFDNDLFLKSHSVIGINYFCFIGYLIDTLIIFILMIVLRIINQRNDLIAQTNLRLIVEQEERMEETERLSLEKATQEAQAKEERRLILNHVADHFEQVMSRVIEQITESSNIAGNEIQKVMELSKNTKFRTENVSFASNSASDKAISVKANIFSLADKSTNIKEVIAVITTIANEINLLAINANIEAIRAGDAGKSFAVVAGEVKNLADQVSKQANEIKYQINNIQESTEESVNSVMSILGVIDPLYSKDKKTETIAENILQVKESVDQTAQAANELITAMQLIIQLPSELQKSTNDLLRTIRSS